MASTIKVDTILNTDGSTKSFGKVLQYQTVSTSATRYTISSDTMADIPELSITMAKKSSTSKIYLTAMINNTSQHVSSFGFAANGTNMGPVTGNNSNAVGSLSTTYMGSDRADFIFNTFISYEYSTTSTTAITYTARASASWAGSPRALYINDRDTNDMRSVSTFTIMEIEP